MDLLTGELPATVEVCGVPAPIRTGWRRAVRSYALTGKGTGFSDEDAKALIASWFARDGRLPRIVAEHPAEALQAALEWREKPMEEALPYGDQGRRNRSRVFDFEADSAIVCADFMRLYGIDLSTWQAHWWRFCSLFLPLAATEGSLVATAMAARLPTPGDATKEERERRSALRKAWALPIPEAERIRLANERIAREW